MKEAVLPLALCVYTERLPGARETCLSKKHIALLRALFLPSGEANP